MENISLMVRHVVKVIEEFPGAQTKVVGDFNVDILETALSGWDANFLARANFSLDTVSENFTTTTTIVTHSHENYLFLQVSCIKMW